MTSTCMSKILGGLKPLALYLGTNNDRIEFCVHCFTPREGRQECGEMCGRTWSRGPWVTIPAESSQGMQACRSFQKLFIKSTCCGFHPVSYAQICKSVYLASLWRSRSEVYKLGGLKTAKKRLGLQINSCLQLFHHSHPWVIWDELCEYFCTQVFITVKNSPNLRLTIVISLGFPITGHWSYYSTQSCYFFKTLIVLANETIALKIQTH